jgi:peptidoglycan-associated lipoprotein
MRRIFVFVAAFVTVWSAGGCSRRPAPAPTPAATPASAPAVDNDAAAREAAERARLEAEAASRREQLARVRAALAVPVYFDYDSYTIRADSRAELDSKIPLLRQDPSIRLTISGHTDERGSTEYNLALGMRRGEAVKEYLTNFGIDASRIQIISYGEERPRALGEDESAWAQNRRAEFEVTSGASGS